MEHSAWDEMAGPYIDDELPVALRDAFERHASTCPECSTAVLAMLSVRRRLREAIESSTASDSFRHRLFKRILDDNPHVIVLPTGSEQDPYQLPIPMEP